VFIRVGNRIFLWKTGNLTFKKSFFLRLDLSPLSKFIDDMTIDMYNSKNNFCNYVILVVIDTSVVDFSGKLIKDLN
jgi:hypothetical protein